MKRPKFTKEQLLWLKQIFQAYCCHVSGIHDPQHFEKNPNELCKLQESKAYRAGMKALKIKPVAISLPKCYWCESKKAKDPR